MYKSQRNLLPSIRSSVGKENSSTNRNKVSFKLNQDKIVKNLIKTDPNSKIELPTMRSSQSGVISHIPMRSMNDFYVSPGKKKPMKNLRTINALKLAPISSRRRASM